MFQYKIEGKLSTRWFLSVVGACDAAYNEVILTNAMTWFEIVNAKA